MSPVADKYDFFFKPRSIAVIGASRQPGKVGYDTLKNLIDDDFEGKIYPVNPGASNILGLKAYKNIAEIEGEVDLALVIVPAEVVIDTFKELIDKRVKGAVVITAGFREIGGAGVQREKELAEICRGKIRVIGPNCLGIIDTNYNMNASFAQAMPLKGEIGFISQSGALVTAILDFAVGRGLGFSKFISMGNKMDLDETHFLEILGDDEKTKVIIGYLESVVDGRKFIEVAEKVSRKKPVIIFKSGVSAEGTRAASSHTGSLSGMDRAYECAFVKSGVIRARSIEDLFDWAEVFASQPLPEGKRLAIITNAGGPGIIATDKASEEGLTLASLNSNLVGKLREVLPPAASVYNPIDVLGDADSRRYSQVIELVSQAKEVDGELIILSPQANSQIEETAKIVSNYSYTSPKPVIASFMGEDRVATAFSIFKRGRVANISFPDRAVRAMAVMANYSMWKRQEKPETYRKDIDKEMVEGFLKTKAEEGKIRLVDFEVRELLDICRIPTLPTLLTYTADEAVDAAQEMGFPVVMKVYSPEILHKTDVGGVRVNLRIPEDVARAFEAIMVSVRRFLPQVPVLGITVQKMVEGGKEVIIGFSRDPQFGPLVMFGLGGVYVEVLKDVKFALTPLSRKEIRELVTGIRSFPLLSGTRGEKEKDLDALYEVIATVGTLGERFPEIVEMEINPLMVKDKGEGVWAVDGRLILRGEPG
ncbi:MAG TPA: CoA-binding protein [Dehalococcoidia bacterium]|nr:CoA-binding protein [Dehalococcoidia bacterium]